MKTKQLEIDKITTTTRKFKECEEKIIALKKELRTITDDYSYKVYTILKTIYNLRRRFFSNYFFSHLANEEGINFSENQIRYFFNYQYITKKSWELIDKKKLKAGFILGLLSTGVKLRDEEFQNKLISKFMNNKINGTDIRNMTNDELIEFTESNEKISKDDRDLFLIKTYLRRACLKLSENPDLFENEKYRKELKKSYKEIEKEFKKLKIETFIIKYFRKKK